MEFPKIRDLREDNDLNQEKIAKVLNISQRAYSHYEVGDRNVPVEVILQLAKYYRVSTDYLLGISSTKR